MCFSRTSILRFPHGINFLVRGRTKVPGEMACPPCSTKGIPVPLHVGDHVVIIHNKENVYNSVPRSGSSVCLSGHRARNSSGNVSRILPSCVHALQKDSLLLVSSAAGISSLRVSGTCSYTRRHRGRLRVLSSHRVLSVSSCPCSRSS